MRSDASRNATAVLDAAREVFASDGVDAPAKQITDLAGVGVGTLYRHYAKRSDLIIAVLQHEIDDCIDLAESLVDAADPWQAVVDWIDRFTGFVGTKRGFAAALHSGDPAYEGLPTRFLGRLEAPFGVLLSRAAAVGSARRDVGAFEVMTAVAMLQHDVPGESRALNARMTAVYLDGLRAR